MKSIRSKLMTVLLVVALVCIITLTGIYMTALSSATDNILKDTLKPLAEQMSTSIELSYADTSTETDSIEDILSGINVSENYSAYVVGADGTMNFGYNTDWLDGKTNLKEAGSTDSDYKQLSSFISSALKNSSGYGEFELDGEEYIIAYSAIDNLNGIAVISAPADDFNQYGVAAANRIVIACVILLVAVTVFSMFFAKTFSKPITNTTKRLRALAQGNLSDPVDVSYSKDEVGVLSKSLEETIVSLRQYINLITVALTNISEGNLCHRVEGTFKGDFFKIKSTFNSILDSLSDTFASINTAAEQVNSGAIQVSNAAQALSQGSTQQASSIEELSATLSDVANQITYNANAAKDAFRIVNDNTNSINSCNNDMTKMLAAMNEINDSSAQISKIIKVIDDIAFQTNILALNAAVEAAREGSKGFGVVADEVRRLAAKSAEAAKQTSSLIEESSTAVKRGSSIAEVTANSLHEIVENSAQIKKLVKDISDASEHQSEAVVQINTGVDQISAVVAANTSSAVGSASASEELSSQSLILKNMIARFKLSDKHGVGTTQYNYIDESEDSLEDEPQVHETAPAISRFAYPVDEPEQDDITIVLDDDDDKY